MRSLALSFVCLTLASCSGAGKPNVLLISIDTLRADRLGSYGFDKDTTPNIDAVAREGIRFEKVLSPIPLTLPAHSSMLTGLWPPKLGMHDNLSYRLDDAHTTLAELLSGAGYDTGAVVSSFVLDAQFNLDQGFRSYNDDFEEEHKIASLSERKGGEATRLAKAWLDERSRDEPFFLFLHYYDPHDDYAPPEPFATHYVDDPYSGEIAFVDSNIGDVLDKLRSMGVYDDTLVVITGDHGEMLGEHGELTHGYFVYQSALEVPLIIKDSSITPGIVDKWISLADVAPTIAGLLDLELPPDLDGKDLSPILRGENAPPERRALYAESLTPKRYYGVNPLFTLVTENEELKFIYTTRPELYDLRNDPQESSNIVDERPKIARAMKSGLEVVLADASDPSRTAQLDAETLQRLATLGYLSGGSAPVALALDESLEDPKDWIAFYRDHQELEQLINDGAYQDGRALAEKMLETRPDFAAGHMQLARIATDTQEYEEATRHYLEAIAIDPDNAPAHFNVANILAGLGRMDDAARHYRQALTIDPDFEDAKERLARVLDDTSTSPAAQHHQLGLAARRRGDVEKALTELRRAVELDPTLAAAHNDLGVTLKNAGRTDEAIEHYRLAIAIDPDFAAAHNNMGSLLASQGNVRSAMEHFRQAVRADPAHAEAQNNLGLALRMTGGRDEAIPHFRAALSLRSDWSVPMNELAWILATHPSSASRNPSEALSLAQRAAQLTENRQPVILDTLAASQAASGNYQAAVRTAEQAIALAAQRAPGLAREIRTRLDLYRSGKPYVEPEGVRAAPSR